jgi:hypothetical protein
LRDANRVAAVLKAAGLEVRVARRNTLAEVSEIMAGNPRYPSWGTVVIDVGTLALWWDLHAPADDESSAAAVAAAIIAWMATDPGTPAFGHTSGLRILPPPEDPADQDTIGEVVTGWPALIPKHDEFDGPIAEHEEREAAGRT